MRNAVRSLSLALALVAATSVAGCGSGSSSGSSFSPGLGTITLISFTPNPIIGCAPTAFTITGTNFGAAAGATAIVTFTATGGATPFGGGTTASVIGTVTSPSTITGTTPEISMCGLGSVTLTVDVTLESGVKASDSGPLLVITATAPAVASISPNPIPAAIPTAFTITGTGFTPGPVTVRFTSANAGDLNFEDGTANYVDVQASATSSTSITGETAVARACTADFTTSVQVIFSDGCCSPVTASNFLTFVAPTITAGSIAVPAEIPTSVVITGANLGVVGEVGTVRLTTPIPVFGDGTLATVDVPGVVGAGSTSFTFTTPLAAVCGIAAPVASVRWIAPRGESCAQNGTVNVTFNFPTLTSISTPTVPALVSTPFTLTGTGFPAVGSNITLRFTSDILGLPIFADGTANAIDIGGLVTSSTTITGNTPRATFCGGDTAGASLRVYFPGGSCATTAAGFLTYQSPALTAASPGGIRNTNVPIALFPNNNLFSLTGGDPFEITAAAGRSFGAVGSVVEVRFTTPGNVVLQGGAQSYDTVIGQVTSATTINGAAPATTISLTAAPVTGTAQVFWEDGTCSATVPFVFDGTTDRTFAVGTGGVFSINQAGSGAPSLVAGGAVAGSIAVAVDGRRNRMFALSPAAVPLTTYDTAPTMNATPAVPAGFSPGFGMSDPRGIAVAPDKRLVIATNGTVSALIVYDENSRSLLASSSSFPMPAGSIPIRIAYNASSGEVVVQFSTTSQIAIVEPTTGAINAIFAIPPVVFIGTAVWNGVFTIRPGSSGSARAYMVYDDPVVANPDAIGTLAFSTGVITTAPTIPNATSAAIPNALAFDGFRNQLIWWNSLAGGTLQRNDAITLLAIAAAPLPGNVVSISDDPFDDRYYASNTSGGVVDARNGSTLATVGTVVVPAAAANASTSP